MRNSPFYDREEQKNWVSQEGHQTNVSYFRVFYGMTKYEWSKNGPPRNLPFESHWNGEETWIQKKQ